MRFKLRYLPLGLVALALAWVAAPALSSQPYMPGAVDFEQELTGVQPAGDLPTAKLVRSAKKAGSGPVSFRSGALAAPERFDLAGLARERRPLELRARDTDGEWGAWVEADDGNPVYFGGADELQLRARGWRPAGTLALRQRLGNDEHGRRAADRCSRGDQLGLHLGDRLLQPDRGGGAGPADDRHPRPVGSEHGPGWLPATRRPLLRARQGRRDPPHRDRERLLRGGGARDRARYLPLSPQRQRLERHRLQRPRRPLRQPLSGPGRRDEEGRRRRPGPRVQRADLRDRLDRHSHEGGTDSGRA